MDYTVLARKCRPQRFEDIAGQESITRVLKNAISKGRVAHAYIFSGPRGVGKTSTARILAKALNCLKGTSETPCNECANCKEIIEGNNMDVIEIDGASNRGIDNIKELRENVKFVPANSPYKIYIIDEVHMLTREAFNALLKTLEEPPRHIKFIFATTEPLKVPDTIMSRCQHFHFKLITESTIKNRLSDILEEEKVSFEDKALELISKSAEGSMRDAESLLDKVITYSEGIITYKDALEIIGIVDEEILFEIAEAIAQENSEKVLSLTEKVIGENKDAYKFVQSCFDFFRKMLAQKLRKKDPAGQAEQSRITFLADKFTAQQIVYILELLSSLEAHIKNSPSPYVYLEITAVKMAQSAAVVPIDRVITELHAIKKAFERMPEMPRAEKAAAQTAAREAQKVEVIRPKLEQIREKWKDFLFVMEKKNKHLIKTYLQEGNIADLEDNTVILEFEESSKFHLDYLNQPTYIEQVEKELSSFFNFTLALRFRMVPDSLKPAKKNDAAPAAYDPRENVKKFIKQNDVMKHTLDIFDGKIVGFKEPEKKSGEE